MTMTDTRPSAALSADELRDLQGRMCRNKRAYGRHSAQQVAVRMREQANIVSPYPCPFHREEDEANGRRTWHVGHAPSVDRLGLLARFLRFGGPE